MIDHRERLRLVLGAGLGLHLSAVLSQWAAPGTAVWLVGPLGASAVLVFVIPASPLAQPWAVVGGNSLSALAGIVRAMAAPWLGLAPAAALAVALAVAVRLAAAACIRPAAPQPC